MCVYFFGQLLWEGFVVEIGRILQKFLAVTFSEKLHQTENFNFLAVTFDVIECNSFNNVIKNNYSIKGNLNTKQTFQYLKELSDAYESIPH